MDIKCYPFFSLDYTVINLLLPLTPLAFLFLFLSPSDYFSSKRETLDTSIWLCSLYLQIVEKKQCKMSKNEFSILNAIF